MATGTHRCQYTFLTLRDYLPCKHRESGGMQCEREEAHGDDVGHWWSQHTIMHGRAGNGWACESFKEPVAMFAYKAYLQHKLQQQLDWIAVVDKMPSVP